MPAYGIKDFKLGIDLRKSYVTAAAGSLRVLRNAFVTAGAELEKRSAFQFWRTAPSGSIGLISRNGVTYVVVNGPGSTSAIDPTPTSPGIVQLAFPAAGVARLADWDLFNGAFYIVLQGNDGKFYHYYMQALVTDPAAISSSIRTYGGKMYGVDGRLLRFSAINDPTKWTPPTDSSLANGSGFFDLSAQDADSTTLVGLEVYSNQMAIFSTLSTQFWQLDADPAQNQFKQLLRATGILSKNGMTQFGSGDVVYLSPHGVRSLRTQNTTLTAGITDIGTPVDEEIQGLMVQKGPLWFQDARCLIQPRTGRLFVQLPDRIYVLSTFQEPAITAWSTFDASFNFVASCISDPYIMLRGDNGSIYQYGGDLLATYDDTEAEIITPAMALDAPSQMKAFQSFDVGGEGTWTLSVGCDPNNQDTEETIATFTGATYMDQTMTMPEASTHISLRFRTTDASRARIGQVTIIYADGATD